MRTTSRASFRSNSQFGFPKGAVRVKVGHILL
jgi:hypothetical protein